MFSLILQMKKFTTSAFTTFICLERSASKIFFFTLPFLKISCFFNAISASTMAKVEPGLCESDNKGTISFIASLYV